MYICRVLALAVLFMLAGSAAAFPQELVLLFDDSEPPIEVPEPRGNNTGNALSAPESTGTPVWEQSGDPIYGDAFFTLPYSPTPAPPYFFSQDPGPYGSLKSCPWWRPCGPANSFGHNWLFYQGSFGADFRPACQFHDDCLLNPYNSRYGCDRTMYEMMAAECANSSNPAACMAQAKFYYVGVRLLGPFVRVGAP